MTTIPPKWKALAFLLLLVCIWLSGAAYKSPSYGLPAAIGLVVFGLAILLAINAYFFLREVRNEMVTTGWPGKLR